MSKGLKNYFKGFKTLQEAITNVYNPKVNDFIKFLIKKLEETKVVSLINIKKEVLDIALDIKPEAKKEIEDYKGFGIYLKKLMPNKEREYLGQIITYEQDDTYRTKEAADQIEFEIDVNKDNSYTIDERLRHELGHLIIHIQALYKRKDLKKNIQHSSSKYHLNPYETDQAISKFISLRRNNKLDTKYKTYSLFIKNLFYEYEPEKNMKDFSTEKFKKYLYKRFYREGLDLNKIILDNKK
ncbi:MAG: hypothetical protein LBF97_01705 [Elusimicrobiota bacterium]|jgi:hypothetical protein|nr:hypothetical protein [Elusimicrobiota bacterium]